MKGNKLQTYTYWENDRLKYTSQQIGDMPYWIDAQKNLSSQKPIM